MRFDTTVRQVTKMSQHKTPKMFQRKKTIADYQVATDQQFCIFFDKRIQN